MKDFEANLEAEGLYKLNTTYHGSGLFISWFNDNFSPWTNKTKTVAVRPSARDMSWIYYVTKLNMTYDWSLYTNEIAITWKYHGLLFRKSLSQLEALEVLEQSEELRSLASRNIVWLNQMIAKASIATVHGNVQDAQFRELKWKLLPWNCQILKSGAKFAAAMWKFRQMKGLRLGDDDRYLSRSPITAFIVLFV